MQQDVIVDGDMGPSRIFYGVAAGVLAVGMYAFVAFLLSGLNDLSAGPQIVVPGSREIDLDEPGHYTVFHEYNSVVDGKVYRSAGVAPALACSLRSVATGQVIELAPASMNSRYSMGSRAGVSVFEFDLAAPGRYEFSGRYDDDARGPEVVFAVSRGFVWRLLMVIFGSIGILFASVGAAIAIAVLTGVTRSKRRARAQAQQF
jgi:hypothetical protein